MRYTNEKATSALVAAGYTGPMVTIDNELAARLDDVAEWLREKHRIFAFVHPTARMRDWCTGELWCYGNAWSEIYRVAAPSYDGVFEKTIIYALERLNK